MPLPADLLATDPAPRGEWDAGFFPGARWAIGLAATLLALFALTIALRSLPSEDSSRTERIIQQPITPEAAATATSKPTEETAPDPGDNPP